MSKTYNIACLYSCNYKKCSESNASTFVSLLPNKLLKLNKPQNLTFRWPCIVINSYNKANEMHQFLKFIFVMTPQIYFCNKTLHVLGSSSVHHQEFFTVHTAMVYVTQVCWQLASRIRMESLHPDPVCKLYDIHHCCVYSEKLLMMDRGTVRNMQSFIPKINLTNQCT